MKKMRKLLSLMVLFVLSIVVATSAIALVEGTDIEVVDVEINGHHFDDFNNDDAQLNGRESFEILAVEEGEDVLEIDVLFKNMLDVDLHNIEVEADISGYEYNDHEELEDFTHVQRVKAGTTKHVHLELDLPREMHSEEYLLRLRILDRNTISLEKYIRLSVEPARHYISIEDVAFSPGNTVQAGRSLLTTVLLGNFGQFIEKDVKVTVEMPALGVQATEFVDVVDNMDEGFDHEDVPEMWLPIPPTAEEGDYQVVVTARYDDFREVDTKTYTVHVTENAMFQDDDQLVLAVGPEMQHVAPGMAGTYGIALTNAGTTSRAYTVSVNTGNWAYASVSESLVVLEPGKNKVVYVDVTPVEGLAAGQYVATATIMSGSDVLETVQLTTSVGAANQAGANRVSSGDGKVSLRNGLEIALIVLVVLLVIIGLIIGFSRLRKDDDEDKDYY